MSYDPQHAHAIPAHLPKELAQQIALNMHAIDGVLKAFIGDRRRIDAMLRDCPADPSDRNAHVPIFEQLYAERDLVNAAIGDLMVQRDQLREAMATRPAPDDGPDDGGDDDGEIEVGEAAAEAEMGDVAIEPERLAA